MSNQLALLGTRENHYDNMVRMYSHCSVVLENLEITYTLQHQDLSFLQVCTTVKHVLQIPDRVFVIVGAVAR